MAVPSSLPQSLVQADQCTGQLNKLNHSHGRLTSVYIRTGAWIFWYFMTSYLDRLLCIDLWNVAMTCRYRLFFVFVVCCDVNLSCCLCYTLAKVYTVLFSIYGTCLIHFRTIVLFNFTTFFPGFFTGTWVSGGYPGSEYLNRYLGACSKH